MRSKVFTWTIMLAISVLLGLAAWFLPDASGDIVGVQEIGAQHFAVTRTVSTGSWIGRRYQSTGYGKAVREAVLHLAFDGLVPSARTRRPG